MGFFRNITKGTPLYLQIYKDRMVLKRLDTGQQISRIAERKFSSKRMVMADIEVAEALIRNSRKTLDCARALEVQTEWQFKLWN